MILFRVNGPFSNMKQFFEDFECPEDSKMNSEQKCEVW
jgi:predicted metalloendopeptidase